jgi:hypothetical protein
MYGFSSTYYFFYAGENITFCNADADNGLSSIEAVFLGQGNRPSSIA